MVSRWQHTAPGQSSTPQIYLLQSWKRRMSRRFMPRWESRGGQGRRGRSPSNQPVTCTRQVLIGSRKRRGTTKGWINPCHVREMDKDRASQTLSITSQPKRLLRRWGCFHRRGGPEAQHRWVKIPASGGGPVFCPLCLHAPKSLTLCRRSKRNWWSYTRRDSIWLVLRVQNNRNINYCRSSRQPGTYSGAIFTTSIIRK